MDIKLSLESGFHILRDGPRIKVGKETRKTLVCVCMCGTEFTARKSLVESGRKTSCASCTGRANKAKNHYKSVKIQMQDFTFYTDVVLGNSDEICCFCNKCKSTRNFTLLSTKNPAFSLDCPVCKRTESYAAKIGTLLQGSSFKCDTNVPILNSTSTLELNCKVCGQTTRRLFESLQDGYTTCGCSSVLGFKDSKPATLYILDIVGSGFKKFGITNNFKERVSKIRSGSSYPVDVIHTWGYSSGLCARLHEAKLKSLSRITINREKFKDGFTETFSDDYLPTILNLQITQYGEKLWT